MKLITEDSHITFSGIGTYPNSESATAQMISDYLHIARLMGHFKLAKFNGHSKEMHNTMTGNEPRISSRIWIWNHSMMFGKWWISDQVRRSHSAGKTTASFFSKTRRLMTSSLKIKEQLLLTGIPTTALQRSTEKWKKQDPRLKKGHLLLHHDNAPEHSTAKIVDILATMSVFPLHIPLSHLTWLQVTLYP